MKIILIYLTIQIHIEAKKFSKQNHDKRTINTAHAYAQEENSIYMDDLLHFLERRNKIETRENHHTTMKNIPENPFTTRSLVKIKYSRENSNSFKRHNLKHSEAKKKRTRDDLPRESVGNIFPGKKSRVSPKHQKLIRAGKLYFEPFNRTSNDGLINLSAWGMHNKKKHPTARVLRLHSVSESQENKKMKKKIKKSNNSRRKFKKVRIPQDIKKVDSADDKFTEFMTKGLIDDFQPEYKRLGDSEFKIGKSGNEDRRLIKLESDPSDLVRLRDLRQGFFKSPRRPYNGSSILVLRKDFIPRPTYTVANGNYENKRDFLPLSSYSYELPSEPQSFGVQQLNEFPAQYPTDLINLHPMNDLYARSQMLDRNDENIVGSYLKNEKDEEKDIQNSNRDTIMFEDNSPTSPFTDVQESTTFDGGESEAEEKAKLKEKRKTLLALLRSAIQKKKEEKLKQIQSKLLTLKRLEDSRQKALFVTSSTTPGLKKNATMVTSLIHKPKITRNKTDSHDFFERVTEHMLENAHSDESVITHNRRVSGSDRRDSKVSSSGTTGSTSDVMGSSSGTTRSTSDMTGSTGGVMRSTSDVTGSRKEFIDAANQSNNAIQDDLGKESYKHGLHLLNVSYEKDGSNNLEMAGDARQMNEFKFNGQIKLVPGTNPNNIRIVHGAPPEDFMQAFATPFPPTVSNTPFAPFFGELPPGHATSQPHLPTFKNGYPWAWHKNAQQTTKSRGLPPHTHKTTRGPTSTQREKSKSPTSPPVSRRTTPSRNVSNDKPQNLAESKLTPPLDKESRPKKIKDLKIEQQSTDGEVVLDNEEQSPVPSKQFSSPVSSEKDSSEIKIKTQNVSQSADDELKEITNSTEENSDQNKKMKSKELPIAYVTYENNAAYKPETRQPTKLEGSNSHKEEPVLKQNIFLNRRKDHRHELKALNVKHLFGTNAFMETFGKTKNDRIVLMNKNNALFTPKPKILEKVSLYTPMSSKELVRPAVNKPFYEYLTSLPTTKISDAVVGEKRDHGNNRPVKVRNENLPSRYFQLRTKKKDFDQESKWRELKQDFNLENHLPVSEYQHDLIKNIDFPQLKSTTDIESHDISDDERSKGSVFDLSDDIPTRHHTSRKHYSNIHSKKLLNNDSEDIGSMRPQNGRERTADNMRAQNSRESTGENMKALKVRENTDDSMRAKNGRESTGDSMRALKVRESTGDKRTFQSIRNYNDVASDNKENVITEEEVTSNRESNGVRKNISPKQLSQGLYEMEARIQAAMKSEHKVKQSNGKLLLKNLTRVTSVMQHEVPTIDLLSSSNPSLKTVGIVTTAKLKNFTTSNLLDDGNDVSMRRPTMLPFIDIDKSSKGIEDVETSPVKLISDDVKRPLKLRLLHDEEIMDLVKHHSRHTSTDDEKLKFISQSKEEDEKESVDEIQDVAGYRRGRQENATITTTSDPTTTSPITTTSPLTSTSPVTTTSPLTTTSTPPITTPETTTASTSANKRATTIIPHRSTKSLNFETPLITPPASQQKAIFEARPPTEKERVMTDTVSTGSAFTTDNVFKTTEIPVITKPVQTTKSVSHEITTSRKPSVTKKEPYVSYPRIKVDAPRKLKQDMKSHNTNEAQVVQSGAFPITSAGVPSQPFYAYGIQYNNANMKSPVSKYRHNGNALGIENPENIIGQPVYLGQYPGYPASKKQAITSKPRLSTKPTTKMTTTTPVNGQAGRNFSNNSPLEHDLNMDDMYWTDSADEIENACRKDKATNLVVNLLAFGDSLTRGYYNKGKNHHPYTMKLQYLLNKMDAKRCFIVENEGRDGDVAFGEMPKRMEEVFKEYTKHFDWVIILGGTNDIYNKKHAGHHTAQELTQNILSLHNIAHHYGSKTVAITIPEVLCDVSENCQDMKQERESLNQSIRDYANDHKSSVLLCDLADSLVRNRIDHKLVGQFFEGGLHLRPRGYELMARLIFDTLKLTLDK